MIYTQTLSLSRSLSVHPSVRPYLSQSLTHTHTHIDAQRKKMTNGVQKNTEDANILQQMHSNFQWH